METIEYRVQRPDGTTTAWADRTTVESQLATLQADARKLGITPEIATYALQQRLVTTTYGDASAVVE